MDGERRRKFKNKTLIEYIGIKNYESGYNLKSMGD